MRLAEGHNPPPSAAIFHSQPLQATSESGACAGYGGYKRKKWSKLHLAVNPLSLLVPLHAAVVREQDPAQVGMLAEAVQDATGEHVNLVSADHGYTGDVAVEASAEHSIELYLVKLLAAKYGFVSLSRRWVAECAFAGKTRFRLERDYECLPATIVGLHSVAFSCPMLQQAVGLLMCGGSA